MKYYLSYDNDEDLARGLLILFLPFRDEIKDIHQHDVEILLNEKRQIVEDKRKEFEKYHLMSDLINLIQKENDKRDNDDSEDECQDDETTTKEDIDEFNQWAKSQAVKDLDKFKDLTNIPDKFDLRQKISELNK